MENSGFDKKLGSALNERRIKPSSDAWERVMLQRQNKKQKRKFPFLWIAALLIVALGIFTLMNKSDEQTNAVVSAPAIKINQIPHPLVTPERIKSPEISNKRAESIAKTLAVSVPKDEVKTPIEPIDTPQAELEKRKIEEIAQVIIRMNESGKEVAEDDVDLLIEKARREIAAGNGFSKQTDASALLADSEKEMTNEFRSNVFQNIIKHKRIRIAFGGH